jgi:diguanylate cyclase (GGDEF)-like protein
MPSPPLAKTLSRPRRFGGGFIAVSVAAVLVSLGAALLLGSFSDADTLRLVLIEVVCLIAVALGAAFLASRVRQSYDDLWRLARRDELTGVGNYRALHERLEEEIARHCRRGREFALILIDLDGFKLVNEEFGHLEGDRVLAEIGESLSAEVRGEDSVFRQGGDEFSVLAPETNSEEAEDVAARLRMRVRACGEGRIPISAGTGFAIYPGDGDTADALLRVADRDLLGAKHAATEIELSKERAKQAESAEVEGEQPLADREAEERPTG